MNAYYFMVFDGYNCWMSELKGMAVMTLMAVMEVMDVMALMVLQIIMPFFSCGATL